MSRGNCQVNAALWDRPEFFVSTREEASVKRFIGFSERDFRASSSGRHIR